LYLYAEKYNSENKIVKDEHLISIPKKPIWCHTCNAPKFAEDLRTIRDWEGALSLMKVGKPVEYPIDTTYLEDKSAVIEEFHRLFNVRKHRTDIGKCLFCGGGQYTTIGNPETGLKHEGCGGNFIRLVSIGSSNYKLRAYKVYSREGDLTGHLDFETDESNTFKVKECGYEIYA
jgi:hypothetical protein